MLHFKVGYVRERIQTSLALNRMYSILPFKPTHKQKRKLTTDNNLRNFHKIQPNTEVSNNSTVNETNTNGDPKVTKLLHLIPARARRKTKKITGQA